MNVLGVFLVISFMAAVQGASWWELEALLEKGRRREGCWEPFRKEEDGTKLAFQINAS